MSDHEDRLRRQLRALTAVNRQLQAQLDGTGGRAVASRPGAGATAPDLLAAPPAPRGGTVRRSSIGTTWLEELAALTRTSEPFLIRRTDRATFVIEGAHRRLVKSGMLIAALEQRLGPRRATTNDESDSWTDGPPVEILEGPSGPPFIVLAGQRVPLRGLPLPYPVGAEVAASLPDGPELDVATPVPRTAPARHPFSPRRLVGRARRSSARHGGLLPAAFKVGKRRLGRLRDKLT